MVAGDDPLAGLTLVASGTAPHIDGGVPFELGLKFNEDARFEEPGGIEVGPEVSELALLLDVTGWFASVSVSECAEDGDLEIEEGVLLLSDGQGSCSDIENDLKEAIKTSGQLHGE